MPGPAVQLVCFDLGGVLVRHCRSWEEGVRAAGLPLHEATCAPDAIAARRRLAQLLTVGGIEPPAFFRRISETCDGFYTPADVERIHHAWLGQEYAGVRPVLSRLVAAGRARTGVLSNTNAPHWARLESDPALAAVRLLDSRHASHLLGLAKPDAAIYREFARRVGVPGEAILFFEDLPENVAAARGAGWQTHLVDWTRETAPQIEAALEERGLV